MYTGHQPLTDNHAWTTERNCDLLMMTLLQSLNCSHFWSIHLSWFNLPLQQPYNQSVFFTGPLESLVRCKHTIYICYICWFRRIAGDILNYGNVKIHLWTSYYNTACSSPADKNDMFHTWLAKQCTNIKCGLKSETLTVQKIKMLFELKTNT